MFSGISISRSSNPNTQSNQEPDSIQSPLLAGFQRSDDGMPVVRGTWKTSMLSSAATKILLGIQNCPQHKFAETLAKLSKEPKFLAFYSKVDKPHFNQKLEDFLSNVDAFEAKNTTEGVFDKFHNFMIRKLNTNEDFCYKASDRIIGLYEYIPELKDVCLKDGKITSSDGQIQEGKFAYIPELKGMYLIDGKITSPDGQIQEGKFAYIRDMNELRLIDGKTTSPDGQIQEGKFAYRVIAPLAAPMKPSNHRPV